MIDNRSFEQEHLFIFAQICGKNDDYSRFTKKANQRHENIHNGNPNCM